jgi:hypothetical protein
MTTHADTICIAHFERFCIEMDYDDAKSCSHTGKCDDDVARVLRKGYIVRQLDAIGDADIADELQNYGAWEDFELADRDTIRTSIVWIAAGNIMDEIYQEQAQQK